MFEMITALVFVAAASLVAELVPGVASPIPRMARAGASLLTGVFNRRQRSPIPRPSRRGRFPTVGCSAGERRGCREVRSL